VENGKRAKLYARKVREETTEVKPDIRMDK
jgi:hypothetical protein